MKSTSTSRDKTLVEMLSLRYRNIGIQREFPQQIQNICPSFTLQVRFEEIELPLLSYFLVQDCPQFDLLQSQLALDLGSPLLNFLLVCLFYTGKLYLAELKLTSDSYTYNRSPIVELQQWSFRITMCMHSYQNVNSNKRVAHSSLTITRH